MINFDDKQSQEFEKKFQILVKELKKLTPENVESIKKSVDTLVVNLESLRAKPDKTKEEIEFLNEIKPKLKEIYERMVDSQIVLGEKLFRNSMAYYENVKKAAEAGDQQAIKILSELEPLYKKMLEEQMGKN